ncbi:MAG: excinuclease ABC subunit A [Tateyamaria sp.]
MLRTLIAAMSLSLVVTAGASAAPKGCPPGLAKKAVPCVPPGQVKAAAGYQRGDIITGDYVIIRDPGRYGLRPNETYYRVGGNVFRVDRDTREILDLIGAAAAVLN